jgi:hypothetical protein
MIHRYHRKTVCTRCKEAITVTLENGIATGRTEGKMSCLCGDFDLPTYVTISPPKLHEFLRDYTEINAEPQQEPKLYKEVIPA